MCPCGVAHEPPRSTICPLMNFALYSPIAPSGGPLVNSEGAVIGVAFAISPDRSGTSYALTTSELRAVLSRPTTTTVSTGACLANS